MNTKEKGENSEAKVLSVLVEKGHTVLTPFGENCRYDLVVDDDEKLHRVQVKTGWLKNGCVVFNVSDTRSNRTGNTTKGYSKSDIDAFVVYCPEIDSMYWINIEDVTASSAMKLRVEEPKSKSAIHRTNWAEDFCIA